MDALSHGSFPPLQFSDSLSTRVECLLTAYHSSTSTTTAHRVYMQEAVPEGMGVIKAGYSVMGDLKGVQVLQGEGVSAVGRALLWLSLELLPLDRNVTLMYIADVLVPYQTNHTLLVNSSLKFFSIEANPASVNVSMWSPYTTWSPCLSRSSHAYHMVPISVTWSPCLSHGPHAYHMVPMPVTWSHAYLAAVQLV